MTLTILKILLLLITLTQGIMKFIIFFLTKKETRMKFVEKMYSKSGSASATKVNDIFSIIFMLVLISLLALNGLEYINFMTGFIIGLLTLQLYFHSFNEPLEKEPEKPITPVKMFSYALKEKPEKGAIMHIFMMVIFLWFLIMLVKDFFI
jgi:hypothetical protein